MYEGYFGLTERPFSIAPDPHYLYMSSRHKEAMAHLSYGLSQGGCFIVLTGEVGTGKTTLCRNLLSDLPANVDVALILNANINEVELLQTVCDELGIAYRNSESQKQLLDLINTYLLKTFSENRHTVLIIDEAQLLSRDVLEQIRLLTNLETTKSKLLQIILIGQPELSEVLSRNDLRQLAQRVTARYHLGALERGEIEEYVNYRLSVAGCRQPLFSRQALNKMHALTEGIPRRINVLADHALLAAYSQNQSVVDAQTIKKASRDVFVESRPGHFLSSVLGSSNQRWWTLVGFILLVNALLWWFFVGHDDGAEQMITAANEASSVAVIDAGKDTHRHHENTESGFEGDNSAASNNSAGTGTPASQRIAGESPAPLAKNVASKQAVPSAGDDGNITLLPSDEIIPGRVMVSEQFLDATTPVDSELPASQSPASGDNQNVTAQSPAESPFGRVLETSADVTGRISALRDLAILWDTKLPRQMIEPPCRILLRQGLRCLGIKAWNQLLNYNRPAFIALAHQDQLHRVVLQSFNGDVATVSVGGAIHRVPLTELRSRWVNEATILWRPSEAGAQYMQLGSQDRDLPLTRVHLNRALSIADLPLLKNTELTEFDIDMSQKVFALQTRYGITGDSRIGNETHLLMNELVYKDSTPLLRVRIP